jgi:folate-binding protein YgfZ
METNKAYITSKNFIAISGDDCQDFLQNIISNDIRKVTTENTLFTSLLTPQGKFLFEFIILKIGHKYLIECNKELINSLYNTLIKYKLRSKIEIKIEKNLISIDIPFIYFINLNINNINSINYKNYFFFEDPRIKNTLARAIIHDCEINNFLTDLNLELTYEKYFYEKKLFNLGIPDKDIIKLQGRIFALEANYLELNAIDQKKGCYIGQENTARIFLKKKLTKRIFALDLISGNLLSEQKVFFGSIETGKILIEDTFPFALVKLENLNEIINKVLNTETGKIKIKKPFFLNA